MKDRQSPSHYSVSAMVVLQSNRQQALKPIKYARRLPDNSPRYGAFECRFFTRIPIPPFNCMAWRGASFAPLTEEFYERQTQARAATSRAVQLSGNAATCTDQFLDEYCDRDYHICIRRIRSRDTAVRPGA